MINFYKAKTGQERTKINQFLKRHNSRGTGSKTGYVAYYAASLEGQIVAAAKFCPLHTPSAARFFAAADWRHVYCLQRLAAHNVPENTLSRFVGWCLREMGKDERVWYIATYADTRNIDLRTGLPHDGGIYRAANAIYCGLTQGNRVEGYILDGQRYSMRRGPKTLRVSDIPPDARVIRGRPKHRYCWAVGPPLKRGFRRRALVHKMSKYQFQRVYQPALLFRLVRKIYYSPWPLQTKERRLLL